MTTTASQAPDPMDSNARADLERAQLAVEVLEHGDGVFVLDGEYRFVLVNEAFERASRLRREDVLGRVFWDVFPLANDPGSEFSRQYRRVMRDRVPLRFEETYAPNGTWNAISVYPTRTGGIAVFFRDVTQRRLAEEALAAEKEKYRSLFQHSVDAVYLVRQDGTILDANPAACALHGMSLEELHSATRAQIVVPDERHSAAVRDRSAKGAVRAELTARRKDGSVVPVEVESVLIDPSRADSPAFVISRDITERQRTEEALRRQEQAARESREDLASIIAQLPMAVGVLDMNGQVVLGNSELAFFGVERPPSRDPEHQRRWRAYGERGQPLQPEEWPAARALRGETVSPGVECVYDAPDGRRVHALVSAVPLRRDGEQRGVIFAIQDVSRLKHVEEELRRADRQKNEFLDMLSHELRNPLAPIRNSTHVLQQAAPGSEQAARARAVIERQVEHLTRLVDDLLDVTRIARGRIELRRGRVDLRELVRRTAEDFRPVMEQKGVALRVLLPEGQLWADADATRVTQVVGNLLHNAAKFTRAGDEVAVEAESDGHAATIRVRDTGAGIDPLVLPHVFEAFVQGERTLARSEGGLGLGLALAKGIAEQHGGTVSAASAGAGSGSEFTVRLPLVDAGPAPARDAQQAPAAASRRVLVVDDNVDGAETLAEVISLLGHEVEVAFDGPSAVARALASPPDVVLCDIGLPGMSGYEVAKKLRDSGLTARLFAVSGYAQSQDVRRAIEAGFDGHVAKPPRIEDLERLLA